MSLIYDALRGLDKDADRVSIASQSTVLSNRLPSLGISKPLLVAAGAVVGIIVVGLIWRVVQQPERTSEQDVVMQYVHPAPDAKPVVQHVESVADAKAVVQHVKPVADAKPASSQKITTQRPEVMPVRNIVVKKKAHVQQRGGVSRLDRLTDAPVGGRKEELDPAIQRRSAIALANKVRLLISEGKLDEVGWQLHQLELIAGVDSLVALRMRAYWMLSTHDDRAALSIYHQILNRDPNDASANLNAALAEWRLGYPARARTRLKKFLDANPGNKQATLMLNQLRKIR